MHPIIHINRGLRVAIFRFIKYNSTLMEIRRAIYHIISTGKPERIPVEGESYNLTVRKRSNKELSKVPVEEQETQTEEQIVQENANLQIEYVLPEGFYVYIQGNASINDKTLACSASYEIGKETAPGELIGRLITKELIED